MTAPEQPSTPTPTPAPSTLPVKDKPWVMRTYAGHSTPAESNALFLRNLDKGQTGLSIAFDLPTQTGYDPDHLMARGEVGKVGVPIAHLGDMRTLLANIPLDSMNTSMTINAPAMWLFALYVALAEEQGIDPKVLTGTTQNDIVKEYLSRGTYIFPPEQSLRLTSDMIAWSVINTPKWNPINICSYHLQEAGATPVQEMAFSLATAISILDAVRDSGHIEREQLTDVVARMSFFVNSGVRFIEELCKMRAFTQLWDEITADRYGVTDPAARRFRYGVQVNSLGLTEAQPENNVQRIVLEMLGVTLSKDARARAIQLPAWNEAMGLPRPWDQQWSLRMQQVLAFETDLLEYGDIFDGSTVIEAKVEEMKTEVKQELARIEEMGGAMSAIDSGYMKSRLVGSLTQRRARIESGAEIVVGVNRFSETEPNPMTENIEAAVMHVDPAVEAEAVDSLLAWRTTRDTAAIENCLNNLRAAALDGTNLMVPTLACARAGVTTGEWAQVLRECFGEFRAPTGVGASTSFTPRAGMETARALVAETARERGRPLRMLVAKPGLDGHSNGAEQVAMAARDAGYEVIYQGIRLTPDQIVRAAVDEDVDCVGISILSGSHAELVPRIVDGLIAADAGDIPVIVGGIIPDADAARLLDHGVAAVFTPKDFDLTSIMTEITRIIRARPAHSTRSV